MNGLKVQCPSCKKVYYETTEKYDPDVRPNGAMVRLLQPWKDWDWSDFDAGGEAKGSTSCSAMLCTGCSYPLAPSGRLTVIPDANELTPAAQTVLVDSLEEWKGKVLAKIAEEEKTLENFRTLRNDQADVMIEPAPVEVPKKKSKKKAKKKKAKKKIK